MKKKIFLILMLVAANIWGSSNFYSLIKRLGLSPMNTAPKEFSLKDLKGKEQSLKSLKGKWILLNFWATWCGPCQEEMPALEELSREYSKLKVIGVAVDGKDKRAVKKFVDRKRITFPIWLDVEGKASSLYQANSVPMVYLISPDWKIVGFMAGAQDWAAGEIKKIVGELIGQKATPSELPKEDQDAPPPGVTIKVPDVIKKGELFKLEVLVSWPAENVRYLIRTPKLTLPEDVWVGDISSETKSSIEGGILRYIFPLKINTSGKVSLGPAEVSFGAKEQKTLGGAVDVEVMGTNFSWWYLLLLLLFAPLVLLKKKKIIIEEDKNSLQESIEKLKKEKYSLSPSAYQIELLKICFALDCRELDINKKIERIEYGGELLSPEEINHFEKKLIKREEDE